MMNKDSLIVYLRAYVMPFLFIADLKEFQIRKHIEFLTSCGYMVYAPVEVQKNVRKKAILKPRKDKKKVVLKPRDKHEHSTG